MKAIAIYPDKRVENIIVDDLESYQTIVDGWIEPVGLSDGSTMYVNEEFLYKFDSEDFNSIASDVCGLGGRPDLMMSGILGPVLILGPIDNEGYDTDVTERAAKWVRKVEREAKL